MNEPSMVPLCISMQIWKEKVIVIDIAFNEQYRQCMEDYHQRSRNAEHHTAKIMDFFLNVPSLSYHLCFLIGFLL